VNDIMIVVMIIHREVRWMVSIDGIIPSVASHQPYILVNVNYTTRYDDCHDMVYCVLLSLNLSRHVW